MNSLSNLSVSQCFLKIYILSECWNQKEKLLQMPTCSFHADIHLGLLLHAYITPPACYRAPREEQYKLVTTHCHSSWSLEQYSESWRPRIHNSLTRSATAALLINPGTPQLSPLSSDQAEFLSSSLAWAHARSRLRSPITELVCTPLPALERLREWCCTAHGTWHTALFSHTEKTRSHPKAKKERVCLLQGQAQC